LFETSRTLLAVIMVHLGVIFSEPISRKFGYGKTQQVIGRRGNLPELRFPVVGSGQSNLFHRTTSK
jgi:hypothetical protein